MNGLNGLTYMDIKQLGTASQPAVDNRRSDKLDGVTDNRASVPVPASRQPVEVEVSPEAKAVGKAVADAARLPDVDQSKVARIKAAIDAGRYTISAERLADKMLRFEETLKERT